MPTFSSADSPLRAGAPSTVEPTASPAPAQLPALRPEQLKAVLIGASAAATLALVVVVLGARSRRRAALADTSSGVVGVLLRSALFAAGQTVVQVAAARLAAKALHRDAAHAPVDPAAL